MFELMIRGQIFVADSYDTFCKDNLMWEEIQRVSNFQGTGGDWRYIALTLHSEVTRVIQSNQYNQWFGIYKPYSVPAIGFKISKDFKHR